MRLSYENVSEFAYKLRYNFYHVITADTNNQRIAEATCFSKSARGI